MEATYKKGIIQSNKKIASNIYEIKLSSYFQGKPGQFYMIRGWEALDPFLPRPISISNIEEGIITFLYEVKGKGTHIISKLKPGDSLELLGPLGNGFDLEVEGKIALISGGIGIAPLVYLAKTFKKNVDFYCGFRDEPYYIDEIKKYANNLYISTEDGSSGHKGYITEVFEPEKYQLVATCGPLPMMEEVLNKCGGKARVYMSMENRMACGIGACLGCTIKTKSGIKRVCKEGPVFLGEEVRLND